MNEDVHKKHRDRMRKRFHKEGLNNFAPHEMLEILLFHTIPRKDTNKIAHDLIRTFGSFRAVLDAPYEQLIAIPGIGHVGATFLNLQAQVARIYALCGEPDTPFLMSKESMRSYLSAKYLGVKSELPLLLCLDSSGKLKEVHEFPPGTFSAAGLDLRVLTEQVLRSNTQAVILSHNHPGGKAEPSSDDIESTRRVAWMLKELRIRLCDHVIFAGDTIYSMADDNRFAGLFI